MGGLDRADRRQRVESIVDVLALASRMGRQVGTGRRVRRDLRQCLNGGYRESRGGIEEEGIESPRPLERQPALLGLRQRAHRVECQKAFGLLGAVIGRADELRCCAGMPCDGRIDLRERGAGLQGRSHRIEFAGRKRAKLVRVLGREAEEIRRAFHVPVEHVQADKEVQEFAGHGCAEFGEPLRRDDGRETSLPPARTQGG